MLSVQKKETMFSMHKKHFVVPAKERNMVLYTRNIFLSMQMKETLFSVQSRHFVVCAKEKNNVLYGQETLSCL